MCRAWAALRTSPAHAAAVARSAEPQLLDRLVESRDPLAIAHLDAIAAKKNPGPAGVVAAAFDRLAGKPLPIYGDGQNVRDWLYVEDHCSAIARVLDAGRPGETYNVGGNSERRNLAVVHTLCEILDELRPLPSGGYKDLITHVFDEETDYLRDDAVFGVRDSLVRRFEPDAAGELAATFDIVLDRA